MAQLLLQHGADVAAARNDGVTALVFAARGAMRPCCCYSTVPMSGQQETMASQH